MGQQDKVAPEEGFRESLKDLVVIVQKLGAYCATPEALAHVCQLALDDEYQLRFLMSLTTSRR